MDERNIKDAGSTGVIGAGKERGRSREGGREQKNDLKTQLRFLSWVKDSASY